MNDFSRRGFVLWSGFGLAAALSGMTPRPVSAEETDEKASPIRFQLGLASYTTRNFDLKTTLEMAKRLDLKELCFKSFHLPLDASDEQIAATVAEVEKAGLHLYGGGVIYMKTEQETRDAFEYARKAGMKMIGGVPAPELLPLTEELVKQYDIAVAIHNHGPGDKVYPLPETAYEKIKDLDPRIGLCIDVGHVVQSGQNPAESIRGCADRIHDFHFKDVSAAAPEGHSVPCGHGVIDLPAVIDALIEIKFDKVAAFEYEADADDPLPGLAESVGYVRGICAAR